MSANLNLNILIKFFLKIKDAKCEKNPRNLKALYTSANTRDSSNTFITNFNLNLNT